LNPIRVLLVDDQELFVEGLRTLLSVQPDFEVVGAAGNGEEALRMALNLRPDVVLMDLRMPVMDGVSATRHLNARLPDTRVIALTTFDEDRDIFEALKAGAVGYLLKNLPAARLYEAIHAAARGESFLQPSIAAKVVAEFTRLAKQAPNPAGTLAEALSEREMDVLRLLASGLSNKAIAAAIYITEGTVKNHITSILRKLEVRDRAQAGLRARDLGVV
jgi:DNA-binding NarL/FixJ family response regulator